jgi:hypothetical protein
MSDLPRRRSLLDTGPDASLLAIAKELSARGLTVRKTRQGQEVIELAVTGPEHAGNGRVVIGYEGWLTWEYDFKIDTPAEAEKTIDLIASLLEHAMPQSDTSDSSE